MSLLTQIQFHSKLTKCQNGCKNQNCLIARHQKTRGLSELKKKKKEMEIVEIRSVDRVMKINGKMWIIDEKG